jgi:hypothetical protein
LDELAVDLSEGIISAAARLGELLFAVGHPGSLHG